MSRLWMGLRLVAVAAVGCLLYRLGYYLGVRWALQIDPHTYVELRDNLTSDQAEPAL